MSNLKAATIKFAEKVGLTLILDVETEDYPILEIWEKDEDNEYILTYLQNADGSFTFRGNNYLNTMAKEDLPAYIADEKALKPVLEYIAKEVVA